MLKKWIFQAMLCFGVLSSQAQASFVHTDWKTEGDSRATLDTSTGIEWLKLNETSAGSSKTYLTVLSQLDTTYLGWRFPTEAELGLMFRNLLGAPYGFAEDQTLVNQSITISGAAKTLMHTYFGTNYGGTGSVGVSYGWFQREDGNGWGGAGRWDSGFNIVKELNQSRSYTGVYLVNDGGVTLSSVQDPTLNINNPNAPVNVADVSTPLGSTLFAALFLVGMRVRRQH